MKTAVFVNVGAKVEHTCVVNSEGLCGANRRAAFSSAESRGSSYSRRQVLGIGTKDDWRTTLNYSGQHASVGRSFCRDAGPRRHGEFQKGRGTLWVAAGTSQWEELQSIYSCSSGIKLLRKSHRQHQWTSTSMRRLRSVRKRTSVVRPVGRSFEGSSPNLASDTTPVTASSTGSSSTTTVIQEPLVDEEALSGDLDVDSFHPIAEVLPVDSDQSGSEKFDWNLNWYAVGVEKDLDRRQPHAVVVLGRRFVLWWHQSQNPLSSEDDEREEGGKKNHDHHHHHGGEWKAFLDQCPHRLAPLSEGRIDEKGYLQCSYHGWAFAGDGACKLIPQLPKDGLEQRVLSSPRACATPFPASVGGGVVFLWPDDSVDGVKLAMATPLPIDPFVRDDPTQVQWHLSARDLTYGYEFLAENVADPSHVPFAHHGVYKTTKRTNRRDWDLLCSSKGQIGFRGSSKDGSMKVDFHPSRFSYQQQTPEKTANGQFKTIVTTLYTTPTMPGKSFLVLGNALNRKMPWYMAATWMKWYFHVRNNKITDGDSVFLHMQEKNFDRHKKTTENKDWNSAYFMPTSADRYVVEFRRWLDKYAGAGVKWPEGLDTTVTQDPLPREVVMDRFNTHTKDCQHCLKTLNVAKAVQKVLFVAAIVLLSLAAGLSVQTGTRATGKLAVRVTLAVFSVAAAICAIKLDGFIQKFIYKGYNHALVP